MASKLNKTRIRDTKIVIIGTFLLAILTQEAVGSNGAESEWHEPIEFFGYFLVALCAIGRIYCTAFLGDFKNNVIVNYGPFSIVRNPLYMFSFIGVLGISLMTVNLAIVVVTPACFLFIYLSLIKREEVYLEGKFGTKYLEYKKVTPRLIPNFKLYQAPKRVEMAPKNLLRGVKDSLMWFLAYPLVEIIEYLQDEKILTPLFYL